MARYIVEVPDYIELDEIDVEEILQDALDAADIPGTVNQRG